MSELTQTKLRQLFVHDESSGVFVRRRKAGPMPAGTVAGTVNSYGYVWIRINGKSYAAHRLAWLYHYGVMLGSDVHVDHINGKRIDNRIDNLRLATRSQNNANARKSVRNTSGAKGVSWSKRDQKWIAQIRRGGGNRFIGSFDCIAAASLAYQVEADKVHGEFARR
jgi:hypothetical protein